MRRFLPLFSVLACQVPATDDTASSDDSGGMVDTAFLEDAGPGLGNLTYDADQVFQVVSYVDNDNGVPLPDPEIPITLAKPYGTNVAYMHDGYMVTVFGTDSGQGPGGLLIYDVSDPRAPVLVSRTYEPQGATALIREAHSIGFSWVDGRKLAAVQNGLGLEIWDLTDPLALQRLGEIALEGVFFGDYSGVAWQLFWQGDHVYVGASELGVFIVDVTDPETPVLADRGGLPNPIPPSELGGFRVGPIFAMGNRLILSSMEDASGWSVLDLSDPVHPALMGARTHGIDKFYATCFSGTHLVTASRGGGAVMAVDDLSDPFQFRWVDRSVQIDGQLYCATQDDVVFQGCQNEVVKVDAGDGTYEVVGRGILGRHDADHGQVTPFGNLVFVGNDHGTGSGFLPHQTEPDTTPPRVKAVSPEDGATAQALTSRVGLAFSDAVKVSSVRRRTFTVRARDGAVVPGRFAAQGHLVNFTPSAPLEPSTTYDVVVREGGVTDWAGNPIATTFTSSFTTAALTTGDAIGDLLAYWPLDEGAGPVALDASGQAHPGHLRGGARLTDDGLTLDGLDGDVAVEEPELAVGGALTVSLWLTLGDTPSGTTWADGAWIVDQASTSGRGWALTARDGRLTWFDDGLVVDVPTDLGGADHHIALVRTADGTRRVQVDGTEVTTASGAPAGLALGQDLHLGSQDGRSGFADATLREVRVYGAALSDAQLDAVRTGEDEGTRLRARLVRPDPIAAGTALSLSVDAKGPGVPQVTWSFGDDGTRVDRGDDTPVQHTFATPGHHRVIAHVTNGLQRASAVTTVTVHRPLPTKAPTRSSTLALDAGRHRLWVVNRDQDTVTAIDPRTDTVVFEVPVDAGPRSVAVGPEGRAWVTCETDDTVVVLEPSLGARVDTVAFDHGAAPHGIVSSPAGEALYVTLQGVGRLVALDPDDGDALEQIAVGPTPRGLSVSGDGERLHVARFLSPDAGGEVQVVDTDPLTWDRTLTLPIDTTTVDGEDRARGVPNDLFAPAWTPDEAELWVPSKKDNILRGGARDGKALDFQSTVRAIVTRLPLASGTPTTLDFNDRAVPVDVGFTPLGDYALVVLQGSNEVAIREAYTGEPLGTLVDPGDAPQAVLVSPDGQRAYVHGWLSRDVRVYDTSGLATSTTFSPPQLTVVPTVAADVLSPVVLRGKRIFHDASDPRMSRDGYLSCAACHPDGGEDARVWDFTDRGEGLRNTIDLRGRAGTGHGPVHWTGNFDEIQDFEHDIRNAFGGSGLLSPAAWAAGTRSTPLGDPKAGASADLDALAAYVATLDTFPASPWREPDGEATAAGDRGRALFVDLGCDTCHAGAAFTNSALDARADVGTATPASGGRLGGPYDGFDVPTLRGLWATPPYLHDGSATDLDDVVTAGIASELHGEMHLLDQAAAADLVQYLLELE